jgi:hypothetical protein
MCGAGEKTSRDDKSGLVGQPLNVELYEKKLKPVVGGRSRKTGRRLHVSWKRYVERAFAATTVHGRRRETFEQRFAVTTNDSLKTAASSPLSRDTAWRINALPHPRRTSRTSRTTTKTLVHGMQKPESHTCGALPGRCNRAYRRSRARMCCSCGRSLRG